MKTYVIQIKTPQGTKIEICQANNVTEAIKFINEKDTIRQIDFIYSEEYQDEKNTNNTR